ncbi:hypothetical protein [Ramlibacter sp. WS9]|uniref:hypothetical protein n=1 Tax=Ramlibacter sp. WS9 TaxID=1882741 RepID=UPI00116A863B|nr:hypothetical protein [Ramlibacter sp. WS9]ROZ75001.1 hypothetical protein EEB15_16630 [Ramlibacter sp. WS9]
MSKIDDEVRMTFSGIADVLIPAAEGMPAASSVGVANEQNLDRILGLRPDLSEAFFRGIERAKGQAPATAAEDLNREDSAALAAIGLIASSAYYMAAVVKDLIGYPGQESRAFDADAVPEYVSNGMLKVVQDRGPIFRKTPKAQTA